MNEYIDSLFSLKGKTAIITGGSRGIGAGISIGFLKAGANIIAISETEKTEFNELQEFYLKCDVSDSQLFKSICKKTFEIYGGVDILVNAAGISLPSSNSFSNFERFSKTLNINLSSTYQCCEIASDFMLNGGSIINITSIGSIFGFPDNPGYVASKGGVRALTKALAEDFSSKKIRVNNIVPGYIKTNMTKKSFNDPSLNKQRVDRMMIKRWGNVDDITYSAIFLASNASSYMTGTDLIVDGGWSAKGL